MRKLTFVAIIISFIAIFVGWGYHRVEKTALSLQSFATVSPIAVEFGTDAYFTSTEAYDKQMEPQAAAVPSQSPLPTASTTPKEIAIPVLNYHSIAIDPGNITTISPLKFKEQMHYLAEHDFHPLTLEQFTSIWEKKSKSPSNPILLTFDDGYADNFESVFPVLLEYNFPATLFISPGVIGQKDFLTWEQVKQMHKNRWDIQPHGMTHPHLPQLTYEKQTYEITEAKKQIAEQLHTTVDVFCYPYGEYNQQTLDILHKNGFHYAFTIQQGQTDSTQPPLKLKRIFVNGEDTMKAWIRKLTAP